MLHTAVFFKVILHCSCVLCFLRLYCIVVVENASATPFVFVFSFVLCLTVSLSAYTEAAAYGDDENQVS